MILSALSILKVSGQNDPDENTIVSSIAAYSPETRAAILNVAAFPQSLVKLEKIQSKTSQSFQDLLSAYSRDDQEKLYQASRFPDLVNQLVSSGKKTDQEANQLIKDYPDQIQQQLLDAYHNHYEVLVKMNDIYQKSQKSFDGIISGYPASLQADFKTVLSKPDVMTLLTDNIKMTVELGNAYKDDPNGLTRHLDSLNTQLTDQSAKDLADYKSAVEKDPKMQEEMKQAADEFSSQNDQDLTNPAYVTNNNVYDNYPYPYWFGYPYWYSNPHWYPMPFYYHTGFYYGAGGRMVVVGMPSAYYSRWFFGFGYRRYPLLYNRYNNYFVVNRTNIINRNVYRGFNRAAWNHFSYSRHGQSRPSSTYRGDGNNTRPSSTSPRATNGNSRGSVGRMNQLNMKSNSGFNRSGFNHFNANGFHQGGWSRPSGGGGRMGGGGHRR